MRLLLLSNSTNYGGGYLDHAMADIRAFLEGVDELWFVPFALKDRQGYAAKAAQRFAGEGITVRAVTDDTEGRRALEGAAAVFVGGGNTFRLLKTLREARLLEVLARRARADLRYLGASAGTNIAAPTIRTTNDMPIVQPDSFDALGLVPFQINPHYLDPDPATRHMGETREERIREFLEENDRVVVGLREGAWLHRDGERLALGGGAAARIFRRGAEPREARPGEPLDDLLHP
ncbi:MAG TPA: dipeptidase PepE [Vicinamibacteria bacterium]|nr:dipeptidase PepE [Vicinamibacteria bacterium]